ncbi:DNA-processing protein DprA [Galactobacillus timonensis]|uniref:DNA-processing protein DprA n=1 Tax=Galactobacillus timonensis TaxID=2041840 RepID=UPI002409B7B3|nr:DNA-processing protein DprA [Galactobacillus timonensis]MDD6369336.1 DNA-processing protein DprA [Galactobacillus timonensis]
MNERERLISYAMVYGGDWEKITAAVSDRREIRSCPSPDAAITIYDAQYPDRLRQLRYPPWVLFYRGKIELLGRPSVTIIGSRKMTSYAAETTFRLAGQISRHCPVVSGLAKGVDGLAHRSALEHGGMTIGVIGSGLGTVYPLENQDLYDQMAEKGLILSEYPHHAGVRKRNFPWRNRILAALGDTLLITQAACKSGTMLTVNEAIALSRDIYCIPYPFDVEEGRGCNLLISQGAQIFFEESQLTELIPSLRSS